MRKKHFHILFLLTVSVVLFVTPSCKSKAAAAKVTDVKGNNEPASEVLFGLMYVDACALRIKGNLDLSRDLFLRCNKIDPANNAVKYELATIYKLLGVQDKALYYAKACAEAEPKNEWYQLCLIETYQSLKQFKHSAKLLENLVKNFPGKNEFKEDLAIEYRRLGQDEKALKLYDELEKVYGVNEQLSLQKSKLLGSQGKIKEAEAELIRLNNSDPKETRYYSYLADFYIERGELPRAKQMYDKIIEIEPNNPMINLALHDYYSAQGKTEEAFHCLEKAFMNADLDIATKASITHSFFDRKSDLPYYREHGMSLAKIMIQVHPESAEANSIYADFLIEQKQTKEAAEYYYKAAAKDKANYSIWEKLLSAESQLKKYDSIEHHSAIAMDYFPSQPMFYYLNGYANIQLKNYAKAVVSLRDGLEFVIDNRLLMIDFYQNMGDAYFFLKDYEKCYKAFENVLKIDSDNKFALNQYASYLLMRDENLERAEKLSRKANELEPDNVSYMDTYGRILFMQKKYTEAEVYLGGAIKLGARKPVILEHYGDLLYRLNKTSEALKFWEAAKDGGANSEELTKKIKEKKLND